MAECPENSYNYTTSAISCNGAIDVMGGATIPEGVFAVELFVDGRVVWETSPAQPDLKLPILLVNQSLGGILIDEGIYLSI